LISPLIEGLDFAFSVQGYFYVRTEILLSQSLPGWPFVNMATPVFHAVNSQELIDVIDVCMRCEADKSENKIDLIPGGKNPTRKRGTM